MAIHAHSTPVPALQRGLLRTLAGSLTLLKSEDTPAPTGLVPPHDTLAIVEGVSRQVDAKLAQLAPVSERHIEPLASTALTTLLEPPEAAEARTLHMRHELRKGLDYGLALMDALDLSPRGLDLMDRAIAQLDALEAPDEDLEDDDPAEETSLETAGRGLVRCGADDAEDESSDEDDELGDEHAPETMEWLFGPKRNAEADRQSFTAWLAAAEIAHACG